MHGKIRNKLNVQDLLISYIITLKGATAKQIKTEKLLQDDVIIASVAS